MTNTNTATRPPAVALAKVPLAEPIETTREALALIPSSLDGAMNLARWLATSSFLPEKLRGKEGDIFCIILAGVELGLPPMAALRGIYVVNGKTAMEGKTKAAVCLQRGAALYIRRTEHTPIATTWETLRHGQTVPVTGRYTLEEAKSAGLTSKDGPWKSYPQRMISHRALGWLLDDVYPDILMGVATAEDFDEAEQQFSPIGGGGGMAIAAAKNAPVTAAAVKGPPPGVPSTAKTANPAPAQAVTTEAAAPLANPPPPTNGPLAEDKMLDLLKRIADCGTRAALKTIGAEIRGIPMDGASRDRLAAGYESQLDQIIAAEESERAEAGA